MIDGMNHLGVTHCCLGNHECDVGIRSLQHRIQEFKSGVWLNSNVPELKGTSPWDVVVTPQGRRIGLIGLLLNERGTFRDGTFKGLTIEPVPSPRRPRGV